MTTMPGAGGGPTEGPVRQPVRSYIKLEIAPHWDLIDPTREFLNAFLGRALLDDRLAQRVGLAAHELMENAVKYSCADAVGVEVRVESEGGVMVTIAVENLAPAEHLQQVVAEARAASEAPDAMAYYRRKIEESLTRQDGKCCLGLARIRCEAEMALDCQVHGAQVRMIARMIASLPRRPPLR